MLKTWLHTLGAAVGVTLMSFLANIIAARALGPDGRGLLGWAMLIATLSASVAQLGLGQAFVYYRRMHSHWHWMKLMITAGLLTPLLAGTLSLYTQSVSEEARKLSSPSLVAIACVLALTGMLLNVAQLETSLKTHNKAKITGPVVVFVGMLLAWQWGVLQVQSALWIQLIAALAALLSLLRWTFKDFKPALPPTSDDPIGHQWSVIAKHALKLHGTVLMGLLLGHIDKFYLYLRGSIGDFGLYIVAFASSRLLGTIQETLSTILYSRYAGQHAPQAAKNIQLAFRLTFFPMLGLALLLGWLGPHLLEFVFGKAYANAGTVFAILMLECVIGNSSVLLSQQFNASGKPGLVLTRQAVSAIPIVLLLPLIPASNPLEGIAALLLLSSTIRLVMTLLLYRISLQQPIPRIFPTNTDLTAAWNAIKTKT